MDVDRFLNLIYYWLTRSVNERRKREIDSELERVPRGEQQAAVAIDEGAWSADAEMAAFQQAARASSGVR